MSETSPEIIAALAEPGAYPHPAPRVEHLQTHISHVFLAGDFAYKLKKPLDLGFLDFSTLEARRRFCLEELTLNRRLCPELYLEVLAVTELAGRVVLAPLEGTGGRVLDYCLKMARMDQDRMMDRLLKTGQVQPSHIEELARLLAGFYARAGRGPAVDFYGQPEQVRINVEENFRQTESYQEVSAAPARWEAIRAYSLDFMRENWGLFQRRVAQGYIRDCHGDLHSGNINLPPNAAPLVFDCIEFNERFRFSDTACDLAFLAMDLDYHGRSDLAELLTWTYLEASGDAGLAALMDFYKCYRAVVRAKVYGFMFDDQGVPASERHTDIDKARAYWRLATRYAGGEPPFFLVCMMGLMGTGKSYLAKALARRTGWFYLQSDALRKQLAGLAPTARSSDAWGQGLYGAGASQSTYQGLLEGADTLLSEGESVIVDASFREAAWRDSFLALARRHGARPLFVEVRASREVVAARLAVRQARGDAVSDGRPELMEAQAAAWQDSSALLAAHGLAVDGGDELERKLAALMARLKEMGHAPGN